jgi:glutathione S-transferase
VKNPTLDEGYITLYLPVAHCFSHVVTAVVLEKEIKNDLILLVDAPEYSEVTLKTPQMQTQDLQLILHYIEDRFPYPPLYPSEPLALARVMQEELYWMEYLRLLGTHKLTASKINDISHKIFNDLSSWQYLFNGSFQIIDCMIGCFYAHCIQKSITIKMSQPQLINYCKLVLSRPCIKKAASKLEMIAPTS